MPVKVLLKFCLDGEVKAKELTPKVVHGLFFSLFSNREIGEKFHSSSVKPFSLFFPLYFRSPERVVKSFSLEVNVLNNALYPLFAGELLGRIREGVEFKVGKVKLYLKDFRGLEVATYEKFLEEKGERDYVLDFLTPTAFKKGNYDYPLPDPYLLVKNLIGRWNVWSPFKFSQEELKSLCHSLVLSGCWIKTKKVEISPEAKFTGFSGRVYFYCSDVEFREKVAALLKFAEFAGVGRKTTMGFGKVKCLR